MLSEARGDSRRRRNPYQELLEETPTNASRQFFSVFLVRRPPRRALEAFLPTGSVAPL